MHTFGHPVKIDELVQISDEWNIELEEDADESIGRFNKEQHTGTFGKVGAISFNGNKTITTGVAVCCCSRMKNLVNWPNT